MTTTSSGQNPQSLEEQLKEAKEQLVSHQQLAEIGLLSAGIVHEIKNPLNFINNFSELNLELIKELEEILESSLSSVDEAIKTDLEAIVEDLKTNSKKISSHGKRAESIIKNMLLQSRKETLEKTPTDISVLLDEYLSLAYHGMRALNSDFNAKMEKELDITIEPINVIAQSIGRVFLNIINNGLYAANEKYQQLKKEGKNPELPTITISAVQDAGQVIIKIKDNGMGIPEDIQKKIFEPFFTTKPVGQGTGLGLPLCYDIVVKEHGGKLELNSKPGEYTEFLITLPKKQTSA